MFSNGRIEAGDFHTVQHDELIAVPVVEEEAIDHPGVCAAQQANFSVNPMVKESDLKTFPRRKMLTKLSARPTRVVCTRRN